MLILIQCIYPLTMLGPDVGLARHGVLMNQLGLTVNSLQGEKLNICIPY